MPTKKQYILTPGKHQFAPRGPAIHHNGNLNDEQARWYLEKYPHIKPLFSTVPKEIIMPEQPELQP